MTDEERQSKLLEALAKVMEMRNEGKSQAEIDAFTDEVFQGELARYKISH